MPHIKPDRRNHARAARPATAVAVVLLLACLGLAACGGSSKSSSSTGANAAATSSTGAAATHGPTGAPAGAGGGGRFKAVRECLQKNGITLPQRTPGTARTPGAGGFLGGAGGPQLPKGVTRAQYEAAIKKCGGRVLGGGLNRLKNPAYKAALAKFATCMRENGVNVPQPNTSGSGPVFNIKGLNTASATFKAAESKCSADLRNTFRPSPGAAGAAPGGAGGAGPGA